MELYRAYAQPNSPDVYRELAETADDHILTYSALLKKACKAGAGPCPNKPQICPRCGTAAQFKANLCYKVGIAGAWNMLVSTSFLACHRVA